VEKIWHIAHDADLADARETGMYRMSTRGVTLESAGFVHCSYDHQVEDVAKALFSEDSDGLVVLVLDPDVLRSCGLTIRDEAESSSAGGEVYPHVYGPIPMDAVVAVRPASFVDGEFIVGPPA
jgi:uncharacterized protein (DUF952 family)